MFIQRNNDYSNSLINKGTKKTFYSIFFTLSAFKKQNAFMAIRKIFGAKQ